MQIIIKQTDSENYVKPHLNKRSALVFSIPNQTSNMQAKTRCQLTYSNVVSAMSFLQEVKIPDPCERRGAGTELVRENAIKVTESIIDRPEYQGGYLDIHLEIDI